MQSTDKLNICIIGPGRLGLTLSYCFSKSKNEKINLVSISARKKSSIEKVKDIISRKNKKTIFFTNNTEAARISNCILICTPDDKIKEVCDEIFNKEGLKGKGRTVIHFSGLKGLDILKSAKTAQASVCCIHPMKSFAYYLDSSKSMKGTLFGVTYDKKDESAAFVVKTITDFLEGETVYVKNDVKTIYHACACIASNYLVTLLNIAEKMAKEIGIRPEIFMYGILNLSQGTMENIKKLGTNNSLTGPIARGDLGTIKAHLEKISSKMDKDYVLAYKVLGKFTAKIALENKWIEADIYNEFLKILDV